MAEGATRDRPRCDVGTLRQDRRLSQRAEDLFVEKLIAKPGAFHIAVFQGDPCSIYAVPGRTASVFGLRAVNRPSSPRAARPSDRTLPRSGAKTASHSQSAHHTGDQCVHTRIPDDTVAWPLPTVLRISARALQAVAGDHSPRSARAFSWHTFRRSSGSSAAASIHSPASSDRSKG